MIQVKVQKQNDNISKVETSGHAMYDEWGKDIVCSAVSTCIITSINAIVEINQSAIEVRQTENRLEIIVKEKDEIVLKLLKNMIEMLESLEKQYPKNITLSKEEI